MVVGGGTCIQTDQPPSDLLAIDAKAVVCSVTPVATAKTTTTIGSCTLESGGCGIPTPRVAIEAEVPDHARFDSTGRRFEYLLDAKVDAGRALDDPGQPVQCQPVPAAQW